MTDGSDYEHEVRRTRTFRGSCRRLAEAGDAREIVDRYVIGTRLRLRSVTADGATAHKLGGWVRPDPDDPMLVMHTSLYLSQEEERRGAITSCCSTAPQGLARPRSGRWVSVDERSF